MAVQAQFGGLAGITAACLPRPNPAYEVEARMLAMQDYGYGALLSPAGAAAYYDGGYNDCAAAVVCGAQSDLTCHNGAGGPSRKRGRDADAYVSASSASLLRIPGMSKLLPSPDLVDEFGVAGCRTVESAMTSTSGRSSSWSAGALVSELSRHSAEIDALVRVECERLRAGVEQARKRQCQALIHAAAVRRMREKEAELDAARRRAALLEERLRQVATESDAWRGLARSNEAIAAGLRATLDHVLLRAATASTRVEGFGESDPAAALNAADDAQSCCFEANKDAPNDDDVGSSPAPGKWACKCCGEREASVLLLPCRHLSLCKVCEPRLDACPVCLAVKNTCVAARSPMEVS